LEVGLSWKNGMFFGWFLYDLYWVAFVVHQEELFLYIRFYGCQMDCFCGFCISFRSGDDVSTVGKGFSECLLDWIASMFARIYELYICYSGKMIRKLRLIVRSVYYLIETRVLACLDVVIGRESERCEVDAMRLQLI